MTAADPYFNNRAARAGIATDHGHSRTQLFVSPDPPVIRAGVSGQRPTARPVTNR